MVILVKREGKDASLRGGGAFFPLYFNQNHHPH